jgi:hypothetical protein
VYQIGTVKTEIADALFLDTQMRMIRYPSVVLFAREIVCLCLAYLEGVKHYDLVFEVPALDANSQIRSITTIPKLIYDS